MKPITHFFIFIFLSFFITNCDAPATSENAPPEDTPQKEELVGAVGNEKGISEAQASVSTALVAIQDTISKDTFITWTDNWDVHGRLWLDTATLEGFNMPLIDFREIGKETGAVKSRFYLGLKTIPNGYEAKLVVVGVNSRNEPMLGYGTSGEYAYDLSAACPPYCEPD